MIKLIAYLSPSGSKLYRVEQIFKYLNRSGEFECVVSPNFPNDKELLWADIIVLQGTIEPRAIAEAWAYKQERGKMLVTDVDDAVKVSDDNPFKKRNEKNFAPAWTLERVKISDLVTVTTETLKKELDTLNSNTHVLPNYLDMELWDIPTSKNNSDMLRLGWAGSMTHRADLAMIMPVIKKLLTKYPHVKFVYCGDNQIGELLTDINPVQHEYIQGIGDVHHYAAFAQKVLQFDIAIAPLVENHFNRCKSFLKWMEYSMMKAPGVYSPAAYKDEVEHGVDGFIAKTPKEWEKYLVQLIENKSLRESIANNAYQRVKNDYSIGKHFSQWGELYKQLLDK